MLQCQFFANQECALLHLGGGGARVHVEMLTMSLSFGSKGRPVIFQKLHNELNPSFITNDSNHVPVWVAEVGHSTYHNCSDLLHVQQL